MNAIMNRPDSDVPVPGYCVHCRSQRVMQAAIQVCNKRGRHDLKGQCATCGKAMYRLGGWESLSHAVVATDTRQDDSTDSNSVMPPA